MLDAYRTGNMFSIGDAARIVGGDRRTVGRWLQGVDAEPVFSRPRGRSGYVSFLELCELLVAVRFVKYGGRLEKVRAAHKNAKKAWPDLPYPFASLRLLQLGGEIVHEVDERFADDRALAISTEGQWTLPQMVREGVLLFDFNHQDGMAVKLYPAGRDKPIVIDPRIAGGRPTIANTSIAVHTVRERHLRGKEPITAIARDLGVPRKIIEAAVRYQAA